jgi:DNA-binding transcriptional LysR family regulator
MADWNDLRFLLELHRAGTLAAAANRLGVDGTTVGRRIAALEKDLGATLVHRSARGFTLTEAGRSVLPATEEMERVALAVETAAGGDAARLEGTVTLASSDAFAQTTLVPALGAIRTRHPGIDLVVVTSNVLVDLSKGDADIAVRLLRPGEPSLVARRIGELEIGPYASVEYLGRRGVPKPGLEGHDAVGYNRELRKKPEARWLARTSARVTFRSDSVPALLAAAIAGFGIALLPRRIGDTQPALRRIDGLAPVPSKPVWVVARRPALRNARVRAVFDFLVEERQRLLAV